MGFIAPDSDSSKGPVLALPIDPGMFVASGPDVRSFVKEITVPGPADEVFAIWSTGEGFNRLWPEPSVAIIDLTIGGRYEWLWDGKIGGNGCQILSYIPNRMIAFSWNAPPDQPESRAKHTWVVVETQPLDSGGTHVRLTHLGFGTEPHWDETHDYFLAAWDRVLGRLQEAFQE